MLVLKKISRKKLIIYSIFTCIALGFSLYIVWNSYRGDSPGADTDTALEGLEESGDILDFFQSRKERITPGREKINVELFEKEKFKKLKDESVKLPNYEVGKENPFEPQGGLEVDIN